MECYTITFCIFFNQFNNLIQSFRRTVAFSRQTVVMMTEEELAEELLEQLRLLTEAIERIATILENYET